MTENEKLHRYWMMNLFASDASVPETSRVENRIGVLVEMQVDSDGTRLYVWESADGSMRGVGYEHENRKIDPLGDFPYVMTTYRADIVKGF